MLGRRTVREWVADGSISMGLTCRQASPPLMDIHGMILILRRVRSFSIQPSLAWLPTAVQYGQQGLG